MEPWRAAHNILDMHDQVRMGEMGPQPCLSQDPLRAQTCGAAEKDSGDKTGWGKRKEYSLREESLRLVVESKAGKGSLTHFTDKEIEAQSRH